MVNIRTESNYLIIKNKNECARILKKTTPASENDIIDFFISLHIVLEISINCFFKQILSNACFSLDFTSAQTIYENLDSVSFIDKVVMFICSGNFTISQSQKKEAQRHHKIISKLKAFSSMRNQLLHGHTIGEFSSDIKVESKLRNKLKEDSLQHQIKLFIDIMKGLSYFFECLNSSYKPAGKASLKQAYLDTSFLVQSK